jgi:enoyl-CoA hydratase
MNNAKPDLETELTTLRLALDGPIATVTLHRPEVLHAINGVMFDELEGLFHRLAADPEIRVMIVTGSGDRAFAAGADIRALAETDAVTGRAAAERGHHVFGLIHSQLERAGKPVIAAINGAALGGGCELALACTLRIASESARLGFPEVKLGLIPGYGGTQRLTRLLGRSRALRLMLSAQIVDAAEALRLGLVDEVFSTAELLPRARVLAGAIASMAPLAVEGVLESVARGEEQRLPEALATEAEIFGRLCGTADKEEGLSAFLAKRPPVWQGR